MITHVINIINEVFICYIDVKSHWNYFDFVLKYTYIMNKTQLTIYRIMNKVQWVNANEKNENQDASATVYSGSGSADASALRDEEASENPGRSIV